MGPMGRCRSTSARFRGRALARAVRSFLNALLDNRQEDGRTRAGPSVRTHFRVGTQLAFWGRAWPLRRAVTPEVALAAGRFFTSLFGSPSRPSPRCQRRTPTPKTRGSHRRGAFRAPCRRQEPPERRVRRRRPLFPGAYAWRCRPRTCPSGLPRFPSERCRLGSHFGASSRWKGALRSIRRSKRRGPRSSFAVA